MGRGMKILKELDSNTPKAPLSSSTPTGKKKRDPRQNWLEVGLFCCEANDELMSLLVEYNIAIDSSDIVNSELAFKKSSEITLPLSDYAKRELAVLEDFAPTRDLMALVCTKFSECTHTYLLSSLKYCSDFICEAMDMDEAEHQELTLEQKALVLMRQKYAELTKAC
jgi:hypothetical protein